MNLTEMNTDVFFSCLAKVHSQLEEPGGYNKLMNEARQDTPIIEGLLRQLAMVLQIEQGSQSTVRALAHRDVELFLALREMERRGRTSRVSRFN